MLIFFIFIILILFDSRILFLLFHFIYLPSPDILEKMGCILNARYARRTKYQMQQISFPLPTGPKKRRQTGRNLVYVRHKKFTYLYIKIVAHHLAFLNATDQSFVQNFYKKHYKEVMEGDTAICSMFVQEFTKKPKRE